MICEEAIELLPWFLNDTLETAEEEQVQEHLEECERCRLELNEAVLIRSITRSAPADVAVSTPAVERKGLWEYLHWPRLSWVLGAAAVIALLSLFSIWRLGRTNFAEQRQAAQKQIAGLEAENQRLRQTETQLRQQIDGANQQIAQLNEQVMDLNSPQINTAVLDVQPPQPIRRAAVDQAVNQDVNDLAIPAEAKLVTLILNSQNQDAYRNYDIEMLDAKKKVIWSGNGLTRTSSNDYTVSLRAESLAAGANYTIYVYGLGRGKRVKVDSYRIRVRRPAAR